MAAIANIVVPDAAATPVNHTFVPSKVDGDTALYLEKSVNAGIGFWPLSVTQRAPLAGQQEKLYRTTVKLAIPVTTDETINGVVRKTLLFTMRGSVEFVIPETATLQNRKDLRKLLAGILGDVQVIDNNENLNNTW